MAGRRFKPEGIVTVLRAAGGMHGQGRTMADAVR